MSLTDFLLGTAALPVLAASTYLAMLAVFARRQPPRSSHVPHVRFDIVVPAHNEENVIKETVQSLFSIDYPRELFRVLVVADNCSDRTAVNAAAAGALVICRQDTERRGKGYALAHAFDCCLAEGFANAIVVVDADSVVSRNLLTAFAARFETGAIVVQADYGVRNPRSSWRTRLMTIALSAFHGVRSAARERLGLSCGLRGNGMGFSRFVLQRHPPRAFSIVEDLEYGLQLGYAGIRVEYVREAKVFGHMAVTEGASRSQRRRWERGRKAITRQHVLPLLREAWRRHDLRLLDLAVDLMVPPIGTLVSVASVGFVASAAFAPQLGVAQWLWAASLCGIFLHVFQAWRFSEVGMTGLFDLLWVPIYLIWKLTLRFRDGGQLPREWVRTSREARP